VSEEAHERPSVELRLLAFFDDLRAIRVHVTRTADGEADYGELLLTELPFLITALLEADEAQ
jgi:hypothetical protein